VRERERHKGKPGKGIKPGKKTGTGPGKKRPRRPGKEPGKKPGRPGRPGRRGVCACARLTF